MAKFGEGDPRWKVEDLGEAGRNVSGWHWEDKDCSAWATNWLKENFAGLSLSEDESLAVSDVKTADGEVTYCQRKGRNLFFYELKIKLEFTCTTASDGDVKGTIDIPSLSDDTTIDETTMRVVVKKSGAVGDRVKEFATKEGVAAVRSKLREFLVSLNAKFAVTRADSVSNITRSAAEDNKTPVADVTSVPTPSPSAEPAKKEGITTKTLRCKLQFSGPPIEIFHCLTEKARLSVFSQSEAQMELKEGGAFELFHGSITGTNQKVVPGERLVQKWRFASWPEGHYSTVDFRFEASDSGTLLKMKHTAIPADDLDRTAAGWRSNFWERIRMIFGFNFKEL